MFEILIKPKPKILFITDEKIPRNYKVSHDASLAMI